MPDFAAAREYVLGRLARELAPNLTYHHLAHTRDDVLPAATHLATLAGLEESERLALCTAALYHDVGFVEQYAANEPVAARIAAETLPGFGYSPALIQEILRLIQVTAMPQQPYDALTALMCDADLDSLGREDYLETALNLRAELAAYGIAIPLRTWYARQQAFLTSHTYFSTEARAWRGAGKQRNLALLARLLAAED